MSSAGFLCLIRDNVRLTTWLLIGACLQSSLVVLVPLPVAILPAGLILLGRLVKSVLMAYGVILDTSKRGIIPGRMTVKVPDEGPDDELVIFILGARFNHPYGRLAPGVIDGAAKYFEDLWKEAEENRLKWGYLGRTSDMLATDDESNNSIITISYWKSRSLLGEFAQSTFHLNAWQWFETASKKHKHLSFMHEIYTASKAQREVILRNSIPFGLAQCQFPSKDNDTQEVKFSSGLAAARGSGWKRVNDRMKLE